MCIKFVYVSNSKLMETKMNQEEMELIGKAAIESAKREKTFVENLKKLRPSSVMPEIRKNPYSFDEGSGGK